MNHVPFHIRKTALHAVVFEGQALVIETEQMQDRGVEVVERMDVLHRFLTERVRFAVADAGLHACAVCRPLPLGGGVGRQSAAAGRTQGAREALARARGGQAAEEAAAEPRHRRLTARDVLGAYTREACAPSEVPCHAA